MVNEIRIYVEGGGDQRDTKVRLREGFGLFLGELKALARQQRIGWNVIACGSRESAYEDFCTALETHPEAFNVLLVDAEESFENDSERWAHLNKIDNWTCPAEAGEDHCFLMAQCMETWLLTDRENLQRYYKDCLTASSLPRNAKLENVEKDKVLTSLENATKSCKNSYHKTRHGFDILGKTDPQKARKAASNCKLMFEVLADKLGGRLTEDNNIIL